MTPRERLDALLDAVASWSPARAEMIRTAIDERDAGEAERVAAAVAAEREACAVLCETWTDVYPGASYARGCAARIRACTTSPAPVAAPPGPGGTVADGWRERLAHAAAYCAHPWPVVRRDDLRVALRELTPAAHPADRAATDAAKAARARGEDVYADGEGRCEPAPPSPPAERHCGCRGSESCTACSFAAAMGAVVRESAERGTLVALVERALTICEAAWDGGMRDHEHDARPVLRAALAAARKGGG